MPTLYSDVSTLRLVLGGTDAGTGTAAQLSDDQLTLALTAASNRVSSYVGTIYDSSTPQAVPPPILSDLTLDLAAWWAWTYYSKSKELGPQHPVVLRYTEAMKMLEDARAGRIRIDVGPPGDIGKNAGAVFNNLPPIFSGEDSNTEIDPRTGGLAASVPADMWHPGWGNWDMGAGLG
jgi:phage gp36-like protein